MLPWPLRSLTRHLTSREVHTHGRGHYHAPKQRQKSRLKIKRFRRRKEERGDLRPKNLPSGILKQHGAGLKTTGLYREHGINEATFYGWKSKDGGLEVSQSQRPKAMETRSNRPRTFVAD